METTIRFLRLEALFGERLDRLEERHLQHAVDAQLPEDADLDFKGSLYAEVEAKKLELAKDVAAMANAQGGAVILGVAEKNGRAHKLRPLELREAEDRRMREIVARKTSPVPGFRIAQIPTAADSALGYYILLVPRSPHAPHAVRVTQESLGYPRRYGPQTIYLAESEIADAYRSRFIEASSQVTRLDRIDAEGFEVVSPLRWGQTARPWLTLALVPNNLGIMDLRLGTLMRFEEWARKGGSYMETPFGGSSPQAATGVRRVTVSRVLDHETGLPHDAYAEFHTDGSGFIAIALPLEEANRGGEIVGVSDEALVISMTGMVRLLVDHAASHAGVHGDAVARASLLGPRDVGPRDLGGSRGTRTVKVPIALLHNRHYSMWERVPRTKSLVEFPASRHTISLDSVLTNPKERLVAVRLLLTDLVQGFGLPELYQIQSSGGLRRPYWSTQQRPFIVRWAEQSGVPLVDTTADEEQSLD